ncbi:hypothetical protein [Laspinema olomoucense]|uniref:hypothetical protein n=1 Tax=Laspinema olomoucense TaxID=3231600 RepID=UPI0021BB91E2|nr:hypothetical protein [Laspinema sp. D3d]MCT7975191.1 hypothetical protein [Laspinema sp. D3d]
MPEFTDFWSRNGWLCQFQHRDGVVTESIIITPQTRPRYPVSDRYRGWTVTALENWFKELDEATYLTTILPQPEIPAFELRVFPAADGNWHAAWPPMPERQPDQIYAFVRRFSNHPRFQSWDWEERAEASRLAHTQDQLARAAQMIWGMVKRGY